MANMKGGRWDIGFALVTQSFTSMGLNSENTVFIYEVDDQLRSWQPGIPISGILPITGITAGRKYITYFKIDMDLSGIFGPPFGPISTNVWNDSLTWNDTNTYND